MNYSNVWCDNILHSSLLKYLLFAEDATLGIIRIKYNLKTTHHGKMVDKFPPHDKFAVLCWATCGHKLPHNKR